MCWSFREGVPVKLEELLGLVLDVDASGLTDASSRTDVATWDSLSHLSVISALEERYDVLFSTAEMRESMSVGALRRLLVAKGAEV